MKYKLGDYAEVTGDDHSEHEFEVGDKVEIIDVLGNVLIEDCYEATLNGQTYFIDPRDLA